MKHGSLFSGIGGFDLAAEWMGWENVFHCEWNPFGQRILKHYWPNAKSYHDITKTDFTIHRGQVDILTGGFPCQPFSTAGKRKGTDDARYLWPEMLRVIREVRPTWIIGENVYGLVNWDGGLVFDTVCADLENESFEVWPIVLPAASVNAPHRRDRVWFVAHAHNEGGSTGLRQVQSTDGEISERNNDAESCDSNGINAAYSNCERCKQYDFASITNQQSRQYYKENTIRKPDSWEKFPVESWVYRRNDGIPKGVDFETFSKIRRESIKAFGNAIVPQVAFQIFKAIEGMYQYEHMERRTQAT